MEARALRVLGPMKVGGEGGGVNLEDPMSLLLWLLISWRSMLSTVTFPKSEKTQIRKNNKGHCSIAQLILDGPIASIPP